MRAVATREDIEDLILEAAHRLLARRGYKRMTMDDLAKEVGIAKGTLYLHFPSKEELVLSHIDRLVAHLKSEMLEIARGAGAPAERVRRMLILRVMFRFDSVRHYAESLNDLLASIRPALQLRRERHFKEEAKIFAEVLREGWRGQSPGAADTFATAHALLLATNALLPYSLSPVELGRRSDVEKKVSLIADLLLCGLRLGK